MPPNLGRNDGGNPHACEIARARPAITLLLILAVLLPPGVAFGILYRQALPVPYQDDYKAILAFADEYEQLPTLKAKLLHIATTQFNEYKIGFEHSIIASEIELTHHLNFAFLTALGDLMLLPIAYLLWRTFEEDESDLNRRLLDFLPISLLFFSLPYWENLNWAMTGLQNTPVIFFSFLAIYLLTPAKMSGHPRAHLLLACLAAALAACSSANGFLLAPVGLLILLLRRAYACSLAWCASFAVPLAAYLYHYHLLAEPMYRAFYITRPLSFLAFFGAVIPFRWPAALLGMMILTIVAFAIYSRFDRTNPAVFYFAVWIVATGSLVAWVRGAAGFGVVSRYSIYSNLALIFCYTFLTQYLSTRWSRFNRGCFYVASVVIAVGICVMTDVSAYGKLGARRRMVLSGIEFYRAGPETNSPMVDPVAERALPGEREIELYILTRAIQTHIYTLPPKQEIR
jgi:hypothetical protein